MSRHKTPSKRYQIQLSYLQRFLQLEDNNRGFIQNIDSNALSWSYLTFQLWIPLNTIWVSAGSECLERKWEALVTLDQCSRRQVWNTTCHEVRTLLEKVEQRWDKLSRLLVLITPEHTYHWYWSQQRDVSRCVVTCPHVSTLLTLTRGIISYNRTTLNYLNHNFSSNTTAPASVPPGV